MYEGKDRLAAILFDLDASLFARTASIVRDWSDVFDQLHRQTSGLQRCDRTFTTRTRTFDANFYVTHAKLGSLLGSLLSCTLSSEWCTFAATFKATCASASPAQRVPFLIRNRHCRIVESGVYVSDPIGHVSTNSFLFVGLCHCRFSARLI